MFAQDTQVPVERSRVEIERTLTRYGADLFRYESDATEGRATIVFRAKNRFVKFVLSLPKREAFRVTAGRRIRRSDEETSKAWEQAQRQRWRALVLVVKAKLEAVESGVTTFEAEFLAHIVLPDNRTVSEWATPLIAAAYESGQMPLLPERCA